LDESIIFIAAEKDSYFFDTKEDNAILFISKDLGNEYKEIIFPEKSIVSIHSYGKKSLIETNIGGYGNNAKNCIYLLDNTSLKYKKIREFSPNSISQIKFNGNFISYNENGVIRNQTGTASADFTQTSILVGEKTNDNTITNSLPNVTPTGLLIDNLPFILMIGLGLAGFVVLSKKRRQA